MRGPSNQPDPTGTRPWFKLLSVWFRRLGPAGPIAMLATCLPALGAFALLGLLIYCISFWFFGGFALLPTYANSGLGGWTFGFAIGYPAAMIALAGASVVGYYLSRRASGQQMSQLIQNNPKSKAIYHSLLNHGFWRGWLVITLIRITPAAPFAATNMLLSAARVPLPVFLFGTLTGIAPRTGVVVYLFSRLENLDFNSSTELWIFAFQAGLTLLILALISYLAKRAIDHVTA